MELLAISAVTVAGNNINTFAGTMLAVDGHMGMWLYIVLYLEITLVVVNVLVSFFIDAYCEACENIAKSHDEVHSSKVSTLVNDDDDNDVTK